MPITGIRIAARIAMIAITVSNSINSTVIANSSVQAAAQMSGVFTQKSESSAKASGIVFTDSKTSTIYYLIKELETKVRPYLDKPLKIKAKVKPSAGGKAFIMTWIIEMAESPLAISNTSAAVEVKPAPANSGEAWKDEYFKKYPAADNNNDGALSWPEYRKHKANGA